LIFFVYPVRQLAESEENQFTPLGGWGNKLIFKRPGVQLPVIIIILLRYLLNMIIGFL
jgi:hypothetical protein